jgi:homoserine dehydrogenase
MKKQHNIPTGLFGFGTVNEGLYELLEKTNNHSLDIQKIVVKNKDKARKIKNGKLSYDPDDILENQEIQLVIEAISDAEAAYHIVTKAMENGKDVITANKKMVASYHQELLDIQGSTGRKMFYEAAVCGAIPVIRTLDQYFPYDKISSIEGVFNGTANFILSKMEEGASYQDALQEAQDLGLAEADPTSDVEGWDAKYKLCISHKHAFGKTISLNEVPNCGIDRISATEQQFAKENNYRIRLKAIAENGKFSVLPHFVSEDDFAYHLKGEANYMEIKSQFAGDHILQGPGAGGFPTASAIVSDIGLYQEGYDYQYSRSDSNNINSEVNTWFYVKGVDEDKLAEITAKYIKESIEDETFFLVNSKLRDINSLDPALLVVINEDVEQKFKK